MLDDKEERIKTEAYRRWEQEGRPHGSHDRHWHEAAQAVENGDGGSAIESEGTTQAVKLPKAVKPKAPKAEVKAPKAEAKVAAAKVAEVPAATTKPAKAKKAPAK